MKTLKTAALWFIVIIFWLLLWILPTLIVKNELILPPVPLVFSRLLKLAVTKDFWLSIMFSFIRVLSGVLLATVLAVSAAACSYRFRIARMLLYPFNEIVKATPIVSFIFLAYIFFSKKAGLLPVFIVMLMVFPVVYSAMLNALRTVDRELVEVSDVFGCTRAEKLRYLWIPTAANAFISSCGTALGLGWKAGIAAEALAATPALIGIGTEIAEAKTYIETADQFAWTFIIIIISIIISLLFNLAMKKIADKIL